MLILTTRLIVEQVKHRTELIQNKQKPKTIVRMYFEKKATVSYV